jgi:hypothetical protein
MNSLLIKLKLLLPITDESKDELLKLHINNSIQSILVYLNNPKLSPEEIIHNYPNAILQLAKRQYSAESNGLAGISSITQGRRSITYAQATTLSYTIDDSIKTLLPKPYARLF